MYTIRPKTRSTSGFPKSINDKEINYKNYEFLIFSAYSSFLWPVESWLSAEGDGDRYDFFSNDRRVSVCKTRSTPGTHWESTLNRLGTIRDAK